MKSSLTSFRCQSVERENGLAFCLATVLRYERGGRWLGWVQFVGTLEAREPRGEEQWLFPALGPKLATRYFASHACYPNPLQCP